MRSLSDGVSAGWSRTRSDAPGFVDHHLHRRPGRCGVGLRLGGQLRVHQYRRRRRPRPRRSRDRDWSSPPTALPHSTPVAAAGTGVDAAVVSRGRDGAMVAPPAVTRFVDGGDALTDVDGDPRPRRAVCLHPGHEPTQRRRYGADRPRLRCLCDVGGRHGGWPEIRRAEEADASYADQHGQGGHRTEPDRLGHALPARSTRAIGAASAVAGVAARSRRISDRTLSSESAARARTARRAISSCPSGRTNQLRSRYRAVRWPPTPRPLPPAPPVPQAPTALGA